MLQACSVHESWTAGTESSSSAVHCDTEEMTRVDSVRNLQDVSAGNRKTRMKEQRAKEMERETVH